MYGNCGQKWTQSENREDVEACLQRHCHSLFSDLESVNMRGADNDFSGFYTSHKQAPQSMARSMG